MLFFFKENAEMKCWTFYKIQLQQPKDICSRSGFCASEPKSVRMEMLMPAISIPAKMFPATKLEKAAVTTPAKVETVQL